MAAGRVGVCNCAVVEGCVVEDDGVGGGIAQKALFHFS